jgi:hypothetical protein
MLRIAKKTRLTPEAVFAKAARHFGSGGEGMQETERGPCCICFAGAGGYVTVTVAEENNQREVEVESREFEYQARRFLELV